MLTTLSLSKESPKFFVPPNIFADTASSGKTPTAEAIYVAVNAITSADITMIAARPFLEMPPDFFLLTS